MAITLALDVYGTLISTQGISQVLGEYVGDRAEEVAHRWREKQLEYSFRRGLMGAYVDFSVCTEQALEFVNRALGLSLTSAAKRSLMSSYQRLPAYPDVPTALQTLSEAGVRLLAFSNGPPADLHRLLGQADLLRYLEGIVSVHDVKSFKPDPRVYEYFVDRVDVNVEDVRLVSSNAFDILGAAAAGWKTIWVRRDPAAVFDAWGPEPTAVVGALTEIGEVLSAGPP